MVTAKSEDIFLYVTFSEPETKILNAAEDINEVLHMIFSELTPLPFSLAIKFIGLFWKESQLDIARADNGYGVTLKIPWPAIPGFWFWMVHAEGNPSPSQKGGTSGGGGSGGGGGGCFTGMTKVSLASGHLRNISDIRPGDLVLSCSERGNEPSAQKVLQVFVHAAEPLFNLALETGIEVRTTKIHRFGVEGKGFVAAEDLVSGDLLRTAPGGQVAVAKTAMLDETSTVYNLSVENLSTYFVSDEHILVHNAKKHDGEMLARMALDREYRDRVQSDPRAALIEAGIVVADDEAVFVFDPTKYHHLVVLPPVIEPNAE